MDLVEAVPNFSTINSTIINQITNQIESYRNTYVLNIDINKTYNRTVITFCTPIHQILDVSVDCISLALELIDMRKHTGEHPRIGSVDVFPLIPLFNDKYNSLISISHKLSSIIGMKFKIPVFCYSKSAKSSNNYYLSNIRKNQYEGLEYSLSHNIITPDYGYHRFNPKNGAIVIGVRDILIAYNVNLISKERSKANHIAKIIRSSGYYNSKNLHFTGKLQQIQALGFKNFHNDQHCQVSTNILDYKKSDSIFQVYNSVKSEASKLNINISGSELVGLVPKNAFNISVNKFPQFPFKNRLPDYIDYLGLNDLYTFDYSEKILEYKLSQYFDITQLYL